MEIKKYEGVVPKDGWKAVGNTKQTDARSALRHLVIRKNLCPDNSEVVLWRIQRDRTEIMVVETDTATTRKQILDRAKKLQIPGFKEAFEEKLAIPIPQDYLDEVGWNAD